MIVIGRGTGHVYDVVKPEVGMSVATLIFLLSKSLEASQGRAVIVNTDNGMLCIEVRTGRMSEESVA